MWIIFAKNIKYGLNMNLCSDVLNYIVINSMTSENLEKNKIFTFELGQI